MLFGIAILSFAVVFSCAGKGGEDNSSSATGAGSGDDADNGSNVPAVYGDRAAGDLRQRARSEDVLFWVDNVPVTVQELKDTASEVIPHGQKVVTVDNQFKGLVLRELVARNYLFIEARGRGQDKSSLLGHKEKMVSDQWLGFHYHNVYLTKRVPVTDEEVKKALPPAMEWATVREIVVETPKEVAEAYEDLKSGKPFETVAKERSISPSAQAGGKINMRFDRGGSQLYGKDTQEKFFSVPAGKTLPSALQTPMGLAIFRIEERQPYTEEEKRAYVRSVRQRIWDEKFGALVANLKDRYPMKVDKKNLETAASDPIEHLDLPVATVGRNRIRFGETYFYLADMNKGRPAAKGMKAADWEGILEQQYVRLYLREAAVDEGMLNNPVVKENFLRYHKSLVVENLQDSLVKKVKVTRDDVQRQYEELKPVWQKTSTYRVSMLQLPSKDDAATAAERLRKGQSLEGLIALAPHSEGGDVRLPSVVMREDEIPVKLRPIITRMRKGDVSDPVVITGAGGSVEGYVVIRMDEVQKGKVPRLEDVRRELEKKVRKEKLQGLTSEITIRMSKRFGMRDFNEKLFERALADWEEDFRKASGTLG